jgi:chorismate dehydratase
LDRKIRVGAVSYLNTKPLLYGILHSDLVNEIELITNYPSRIAQMLLSDEIDIGLVPVSVIPEMKEYYLNTNYCIGSEGAVASVALFSEVPLEEIETVLLDYQSRTSVEMARILVRDYWKLNPAFRNASEDFRSEIKGRTAGVVIGDRALEQRKISPYVYDLGEAWKIFTGLPFVYAAWISNKRLKEGFVQRFEKTNGIGVNNIELVLKELNYDLYDLRQYFSRNISYVFDEDKRRGLKKFLQLMQTSVDA